MFRDMVSFLTGLLTYWQKKYVWIIVEIIATVLKKHIFIQK